MPCRSRCSASTRASLLWRLHLLGAGRARARCRDLVAGWDLADASAGHYAFNDVHALMALLAPATSRAPSAGSRAAPRARCDAPTTRARSNHAMAREVGLPLMRGAAGLRARRAARRAAQLYALRAQAQRFGGSHAQRDLIDQTLLAACARRAAAAALGRALLNERRLAKPVTPLTRHWARAALGAPGWLEA